MPDIEAIHHVCSKQPRMNADLCGGIVNVQTNQIVSSGRTAAEEYLHEVWTSASQSFPPGLKYLGCQRCTPFEEFSDITRPMKPYRSFDLNQSDTYLMKFMFSFDGVPLYPPRYIHLPYPRDGDLLFLGGTRYKLTPVIGGRVFNVEVDKVYMPTPRARLIFAKTPVTFVLNNQVRHANAVNSPLYNVSRDDGVKTRDSLLIHYMLAEYGLTETMRRYYGAEVRVGGKELDALVETGEWFVYRSIGRSLGPSAKGGYAGSDIRIAIPADHHKPIHNSIVGGIFYVLDHWPNMMDADDVDNPDNWLRLLSRFIFKTTDGENKMFEEMQTHRRTIRRYMDTITKGTLLKENIHCETIYDLFHYMNIHFDDMLIHNDIGSMYNQELTSIKHLLYDIVYNIFILMFDLQKLSGDRVNRETITKRMDRILRRDYIFKISKHAEVTADSIAANCKPYNATCNMISQTRVSMAGKKPNKHGGGMLDEASLLHASQVEVGSVQMLSKADPTGRSKCNPFMFFGQPNYIQQNPKLEGTIERLQKIIK